MITLLYDGECGFCRKMKGLIESLDWLHTMKWVDRTAGRPAVDNGEDCSLCEVSVGSIVAIRHDGRRFTHWRAVKRIWLRLPITWMLVVPPLIFLPIFNPIGDRVYGWIARNRARLGGSNREPMLN